MNGRLSRARRVAVTVMVGTALVLGIAAGYYFDTGQLGNGAMAMVAANISLAMYVVICLEKRKGG
jgi:hypothetical protein